jgi:hypothetical protein
MWLVKKQYVILVIMQNKDFLWTLSFASDQKFLPDVLNRILVRFTSLLFEGVALNLCVLMYYRMKSQSALSEKKTIILTH